MQGAGGVNGVSFGLLNSFRAMLLYVASAPEMAHKWKINNWDCIHIQYNNK